jgi:hypothetical protein
VARLAYGLFIKYLPGLNLTVIPVPQLLLSAIRAKADFLITGDKRHFGKLKDVEKYQLTIVTPSDFVDSILPGILKHLEPT